MSGAGPFHATLSPAEQRLVEGAQRFATDDLSPITGLDIPTHLDLLRRACHAGLAGIEVPQAMGGAGASFYTRMRVCEELANGHAGFAFSLVNHHNIIARVAQSGHPELQRALIAPMLAGTHVGCTAMTEPQSGSDFAAMQTRAVRSNGGWVLDGGKAWITNAAFADVFLVYAQTDPDAGAAGIAGFIVLAEDDGFKRSDAYTASGIEGMGVGGFELKDCWIPEERVLYAPGNGFRSAMRGVNQARVHVAAMNASLVEQALNTALEYTTSRRAFNQTIAEFQGIGWSLADVATHLHAMRLLAHSAACTIDAGEDAQVAAAMAKKYANDHAAHAILACMQAMGAQGMTQESGLARLLGWAKAFCYTDGTPEMMNERIIRNMLKRINLKRKDAEM